MLAGLVLGIKKGPPLGGPLSYVSLGQTERSRTNGLRPGLLLAGKSD